MPTVPAPLAGLVERTMGTVATIAAVHRLSPGLLRADFSVSPSRRKSWTAGQDIEVRVGERELRHYTVMSHDPAAGEFSVLFALHGSGPGDAWALGLHEGTDVAVLGPGNGLAARAGGSGLLLLLGDATTIGTFVAVTAAGGARSGGAVEVPAEDVEAAAAMLPALTVLPAGPHPGAALLRWLAATVSEGDGPRPDVALLAGHAQTIQALRAELRAGADMPRRAILTSPYWSTGKAGL